jgi:hypothetical protein
MRLNKITYYLILLIYLIGGTIAIFLSAIYGFNREQIGFAFIVGSLLSLFVSQKFQISNSSMSEQEKSFPHLFKISLIIWIYLALLSVFIFLNSMQNYYLPLTYFISISFLGLIIAIQILIPQKFTKFRMIIILTEIIILSTILSASFLFLFPSSYGNDSSFHVEYILNILNSGNIESYGYAGQYQIYPIYQIFFVETMIIANVGIKLAQFVLALSQILFLLLIFIICYRQFNYKIALISILIISLSTNLIVSKYTYYPGGFSVVFFIFLLYFFFSSNSNSSAAKSAMLIIVYIASIFTHPLIHFVLFFTLLMMFISSKILRLAVLKIPTTFILLTFVLTLTQWMRPIGNEDLFSALVRSISIALGGKEVVTQATLSPFYNWAEVLLYELGYTILILLGITGALWLLRTNKNLVKEKTINIQEETLLLSVVMLIFIPLPYILAIIYPQSLPARWFPFSEVLGGIFAGVSIFIIYYTLSRYKLHYLTLLIMFVLIFFSITSPTANPNNQLYSKNLSGRAALTTSEIYAAEFLNSINLKYIHGNSNFMVIAFNKVLLNQAINFINPTDQLTYNQGFTILRDYDLKKGFFIPLYGAKGKLVDIMFPNEEFMYYLNNTDKIYDNNQVSIYLNENKLISK